MTLERGLYEQILTEALAAQLPDGKGKVVPLRQGLHPDEAAGRLAFHLARVVERALRALPDAQRVEVGTALVRGLIEGLEAASEEGSHKKVAEVVRQEQPLAPGELLQAMVGRLPDGRPEAIPAPILPLLDTALLTNAPGEPRVGAQIKTEIPSADRIDVVMAFIRRSGIEPLLDELRAHCAAGRELRVLTTTYTGSTEALALDSLQALGAQVRVSYDTSTTRLHAKAWLFHRGSGFSTAYIGSSNLTHSAQVSGLEDLYAGGKSWSDLRAEAGLPIAPPGSCEKELRRACGRLLHVDDQDRLDAWVSLLAQPSPPAAQSLGEKARRRLRMLVAQVTSQAISKEMSLDEGASLLWSHPQVCAELRELLGLLTEQIAHLALPLAGLSEVPLQVHARYTRLEILAAFGVGVGARVLPWQTGVYWVEEARTDLLAFTLDKTVGHFSPTTRYRDYAISPELIHWESQSVTRARSETGQRYQHHARQGSRVMLFARLRSDERAFYFLGPASYVRHEGEMPMAVTWRLEHPLPGDLFSAFAAAVA